jgi:ubiquinone/menaquinone biosynthesis C-methylase UbiE
VVPWGLDGVSLGDNVLEVGAGFGATTRQLVREVRAGRITALELNDDYCRHLRSELGEAVDVVQGDATAIPFGNNQFSAVVCFAMLHHIPLRQRQDRMFAEVARVLRSGGLFAGTDSIGTGWLFRMMHIGDTLLPSEPGEFPSRLRDAGLVEPLVDCVGSKFRFRARKP